MTTFSLDVRRVAPVVAGFIAAYTWSGHTLPFAVLVAAFLWVLGQGREVTLKSC